MSKNADDADADDRSRVAVVATAAVAVDVPVDDDWTCSLTGGNMIVVTDLPD